MQRTPPPKINNPTPSQCVDLHKNLNDINQCNVNTTLMREPPPRVYQTQSQQMIPQVFYNQNYQPIPSYYDPALQMPNQFANNTNLQTQTGPYLHQPLAFNYQYPVPPIQQQHQPGPSGINYSTNEWINVKYKKRPRNGSPEVLERMSKQSTLKDYWLSKPVPTANRFTNLPTENEDKEKEDKEEPPTNTPKEIKPPPIFVDGVENIKPLEELLNSSAPNSYTMKSLYNNQVKIQPHTSECYTKIVKALIEKDTKFYTYQLKNERSFRVVVRNIHQSTEHNHLKNAIEELGHKVKNISNIRQRTTNINLPLFNIELAVNPNNKDIYKVTKLLNTIVKVEPPLPKREVPQCIKCQNFGHTKKYCHRNPRCVKCTGDHATDICPRKLRDKEVRCVNCGEDHPANYRGCSVYKTLQMKMYPSLRERSHLTENKHTTHSGISYAQIAGGNTQKFQTDSSQQQQYTNTTPVQQPQQLQPSNHLELMLTRMMEKMDKMMDLLTALVTKML